jgi:hypothetical protein
MTLADILNQVEKISLKFQICKDKLNPEEAAHLEKSIKAFSLIKQMVELTDFDINEKITIDDLPSDAKKMIETMQFQLDIMEREAQAMVNEYFPAGS